MGRGGKGVIEGEKGRERERERERERGAREREEVASSPFYSESGLSGLRMLTM